MMAPRGYGTHAGRPVAEPFEHGGKVESARFSPDGRRVLTASRSGSAHIWDVPPVPLLNPHSSRREEADSLPVNNESFLTSAATVREDESPGVPSPTWPKPLSASVSLRRAR
jgi:WD40 repeat protein